MVASISVFVRCEPMGAPRQSSSDRWKQRPVVIRYRDYKDTIRNSIIEQEGSYIYKQLGKKKEFKLTFYLPFPKSYSQRKRAELSETPHNQKPDIDNLIKAVFDTICEDDKHISKVTAEKFWQKNDYFFPVTGVQICGY